MPVSFYDGDPSFGAPRLGTIRISRYLRPGEFEDVVLVLPFAVTTASSVWIVADDVGGLHGFVTESDEGNNAFDSGRALLAGGQADLVVTSVDTSGLSTEGQTLAVSGSVAAAPPFFSGPVRSPEGVTSARRLAVIWSARRRKRSWISSST